MNIRLIIPMKTVSGMNAREHYMARSRRVKLEREAIAWRLNQHKPLPVPCTVTLTRLAPSAGLDGDNLQSAFKGCRDEVAKWLGIDDKSPLVTWKYGQRREKHYGVVVKVSDS